MPKIPEKNFSCILEFLTCYMLTKLFHQKTNILCAHKSIGFMCSLLAHIEHVPLHINYFSIFLNMFCTYVLGV
jgi:hypothetical protein